MEIYVEMDMHAHKQTVQVYKCFFVVFFFCSKDFYKNWTKYLSLSIYFLFTCP